MSYMSLGFGYSIFIVIFKGPYLVAIQGLTSGGGPLDPLPSIFGICTAVGCKGGINEDL